MRVAIVFESVFGNSRMVAEAVAAGLRQEHPAADVRCLPVGTATADDVADVDLLVVGGPTHMRTLSSRVTRTMGLKGEAQKAAQEGRALHAEPGVDGPGLREWLAELPDVPAARAAVFDTRADARFAGGAGPRIARRLQRKGYRLVTEPEPFYVSDTAGPILDGELQRARQWGANLVTVPLPAA